MKEFSKKIREKGYTLKSLAARWELSPVRIGQISTNPSRLHLDALAGLPGDPDDPQNLDDFEDHMANKSPADVCSVLFSGAKKYGWTHADLYTLAEEITSTLQMIKQVVDFNNRRKKHPHTE